MELEGSGKEGKNELSHTKLAVRSAMIQNSNLMRERKVAVQNLLCIVPHYPTLSRSTK